jgi:hypothetical protein
MEVDGESPVSRIAHLESLVARKQQRVDELAEQREDVLLKAEELINASLPATQPLPVVQRDLMLADLADKLKLTIADLEVSKEALNSIARSYFRRSLHLRNGLHKHSWIHPMWLLSSTLLSIKRWCGTAISSS